MKAVSRPNVEAVLWTARGGRLAVYGRPADLDRPRDLKRAWDRARGIARQLCRGPLSLADPSQVVNVHSFRIRVFLQRVRSLAGSAHVKAVLGLPLSSLRLVEGGGA